MAYEWGSLEEVGSCLAAPPRDEHRVTCLQDKEEDDIQWQELINCAVKCAPEDKKVRGQYYHNIWCEGFEGEVFFKEYIKDRHVTTSLDLPEVT